MREGGESFLNEKYPDLQHSQEVESAVNRQEIRTGEKAKDKSDKINAYLDRLEEVFNPDNPDKKERRVDILKNKLHELFVVKPEEIPKSYFSHQKQIARERGYGDIEITDEMQIQMASTIIHDQAKSLDAWVDYLGSEAAPYPDWLKYFAFRSITKLSEYDKDKKEFKKRSKGTTAPFPDINREALAYVLDSVKKSHKKEAKEGATDEQWEKLLKTANFGKLYGYAIDKITPASEAEKENIQGEWIKYDQGSEAKPLYESLQGHGTGWCTAGEGVAKTQLQAGDFYVFYSKDQQGDNKVPRVAIRMENGEIAEVRGINADQNLEPVMTDIAKDKVKELPGAENYEKKVSDMKRLTEIERKFISARELQEKIHRSAIEEGIDEHKSDEELELEKIKSKNQKIELTIDELKFLYEIDYQIDGFGYSRDPRITEIRCQRDIKKDYAQIYGIENPESIALKLKELDDKTETFIGNFDCGDIEISLRYAHLKKELPKNLKRIVGNVNFRNSEIKSLGKLKIISGNANFDESKVEDLGDLQAIGGSASFVLSKIENLGSLQSIGGHIYIDRNSKLDFSKVEHKVEHDVKKNVNNLWLK